jgi:hypothetical protein
MIKPLHVATVGGHPLRFFKTPLDDGCPDLHAMTTQRLHSTIILSCFMVAGA